MTGSRGSGGKGGPPRKGGSPVTENRKAAATVLWAVSRGRRLDRALDEATEGLPPRDRRWVQEAAYGTIRLRGRLDFLLDLHLSKGTSSLHPRALDLLRLGAYQLLNMSGVPSYAAISQTVDQVKTEMGPGGGRMANGVLRSLLREGGEEARFPALEEDPLGHLTSWGSHPEWMVARWLKRWGAEETGALIQANNSPPPLYFRPLGEEAEETPGRMAEAGWSFRPAEGGVPCLRLEDGTNPARLLADFMGIVQDPGAALVTVYADPPPGKMVVDLCSAPGGKTMALASAGRRVLAGDRSRSRLRLVRENRDRLGQDVLMVVADARHPPLSDSPFLLLDVPCSGTGTLRRHPDARWRLTLEILQELVELQGQMLDSCASSIPMGGHLVYSTCTLEEEENEGQVASFLAKNTGFRLEETGSVSPRFLTEEGYLRVLPQDGEFDGAFSARMVRAS
jgi:16S rRNA (cytosine967-C5)-methyltransferase